MLIVTGLTLTILPVSPAMSQGCEATAHITQPGSGSYDYSQSYYWDFPDVPDGTTINICFSNDVSDPSIYLTVGSINYYVSTPIIQSGPFVVTLTSPTDFHYNVTAYAVGSSPLLVYDGHVCVGAGNPCEKVLGGGATGTFSGGFLIYIAIGAAVVVAIVVVVLALRRTRRRSV